MRLPIRSLLAIAALAATPLAARDLPVPPDKGWQHAATGLVLRATLLGLPRTRLTDTGEGENDIVAQFNDPALATSATVYLFHSGVPSVPIWFDRSDYALMHRPNSPSFTPAGPPTAFAPPRTGVDAGLRRVYTPDRGPYRGEALAMMPLGGWLVAIRLSSSSEGPAALDLTLSRLIAELGWPAVAPPTAPAAPVAACADRLRFHHAKAKQPDMMQALLGSALISAVENGKAKPVSETVTPWCRDGEPTAEYGVYRAGGTGYLLAVNDAGRSVEVNAAIAIPGEAGTGGYSVTARGVDGTAATCPSFDRLPAPDQVLALVQHAGPITRVSGGGKQITISSGLK